MKQKLTYSVPCSETIVLATLNAILIESLNITDEPINPPDNGEANLL